MITSTTRALVLHAERDPMPGIDRPGPNQLYRHPRLTIESRDLGPLGHGMVRTEVVYAGICGTDLHAVKSDPTSGYIVGSSPLAVGSEGRVLGHEAVGRVIALGEGVEHLQPGMLVTFESIIRCHHCEPCRRGDFNQCAQAVLLGMERDGLFATATDVPAFLAHDVTPLDAMKLGLEMAACIEPAACAYVACSLSSVRPGDEVVIFGAGPIGLFAAMLAKIAFGAGSVHMVEPLPFRRELASEWADRTSDVEEFFAEPPHEPPDVIMEASGAVENVNRSVRMVAPNARIVLLARGGQPLTLQDVDHFVTNSVSLVGSRGHLCGAFARVLRLVRAGRLPLHAAVTDVVDGLDELRDRLSDPVRTVERNCKVLARIARG